MTARNQNKKQPVVFKALEYKTCKSSRIFQCLRWAAETSAGRAGPRDEITLANEHAVAACARTRAVALAPAMAAAGLLDVDLTDIKTRSIERTLLPLIKQVCYKCMRTFTVLGALLSLPVTASCQ
jgi:hypothetical protein